MNSRISWKGILISLSVLILFVGTFRVAIGDVTFPNIFTSGTTISSSQVNANFAAINNRQTATAGTLAGNYGMTSLETQIHTTGDSNIPSIVCSSSVHGTLTLTAAGSYSVSGSGYGGCDNSLATASANGTFTVSTNGSVTLNPNDTSEPDTHFITCQASKDLNLLVCHSNHANINLIMNAVRM
ncbi:MAG: hypothetical protein NTV01_20525 [Bacteroidia bacterium]|nr:hypothetical protein [Bacteroidia bacterium]